MASALPLRPSIDHTPQAKSAIDLGEEGSTDVLEALASETARDILSALATSPATASDLADVVDTSLQNAHYHLTNLREADLVTQAGTWYSCRGKEMTVYALTSERLELRIEPEGAAVQQEPPEQNATTSPTVIVSD